MVKKGAFVPDRGDVVWIDLNPIKGHEQAHTRPALVLSPKAYNQKKGMIIACPITSQIKGYPFEVAVDEKKVSGVVLADQVRSLDWRNRNVKFIQKVRRSVYEEVAGKLSILITG
jgi:mRNA interferase MazF